MPSITDFMTSHHRDCDELYASAEKAVAAGDWAIAEPKARRFRASMDQHFAMEENVLFPAFEAATGMSGGPSAIMRMEHAQMRYLLASMDEAIAAKDAKSWLTTGDTLLVMIQQHNMKEEGMLYPMSDDALSRDASDLLGRLSDVRDRG